MVPRKKIATIALCCALAGCGEEGGSQPPGPRPIADHPAPTKVEPQRPVAPVVAPANLPAAPADGCAFAAPVRVWEGEGWASIAAADGGFVVAGTAPQGQGETAFAVFVGGDGATRTIAQGALEHPATGERRRASPAVAAAPSRVALALADGDRRVLLAELDPSAQGARFTWRSVGTGASLRFAPALAAEGAGWAMAWTLEGETLRMRAARVDGEQVRAARDIVPPAGGSSAPTFIVGAPAQLVLLDARAAVSVAYRVRVDRSGFGDPVLTRPINLAAEPPEIAVVHVGTSDWLAYTAVGSSATSAVGLLPLVGTAPAQPLVPGTGYGALHVSVASLSPERAVFVADAPQGTTPTAPRELHVRVLSNGALGDPAIVRGPSNAASRGRIAHGGNGVVAVAFTEAAGIHVAIGRCAER